MRDVGLIRLPAEAAESSFVAACASQTRFARPEMPSPFAILRVAALEDLRLGNRFKQPDAEHRRRDARRKRSCRATLTVRDSSKR